MHAEQGNGEFGFYPCRNLVAVRQPPMRAKLRWRHGKGRVDEGLCRRDLPTALPQ